MEATCGICMEGEEGDLLSFCDGKHRFCKRCLDDWIAEGVHRKLAECHMIQDDAMERVDGWILCPLCREKIIDAGREIKTYTGVVQYEDPLIHLKFRNEYRDGKLHGSSVSRYSNGEKHSEGFYRDGRKDGLHISWWKNGQKRTETHYVDGMKEGKSCVWYKSGMRMAEFHYSMGVSHGPHRRWYESGGLEEEGQYRMSRPYGIFRSWNEAGNLVHEENYDA